MTGSAARRGTARGHPAIAVIGDPLRRSLFEFVKASPHPVSRDEAAAFLSQSRSTAVFHLERLVEAGLLTTEFKRTSGKSGPGAGRPAKLYRAADDEVSVTIPERRYDLLGELLAQAIDEAQPIESAREALIRIAEERGRRLGAEAGTLERMLVAAGYEPHVDADGTITLTNCPFHRLAARHTDLVCTANEALLSGAVTGCGGGYDAALEPGANRCCIRLHPAE